MLLGGSISRGCLAPFVTPSRDFGAKMPSKFKVPVAVPVSLFELTGGKLEMQHTTVDVPLKRYKPITNGIRHAVLLDKKLLWRGKPIKALTRRIKSKGGRGHKGHICTRHRGGGKRRLYRFVDFKRQILDQPAIVQRFEYDPNRSAFIALIAYPDGQVSYILAPHGLKVGDTVEATRAREIDIKPGNTMPLSMIPLGTMCHNLEVIPGKGAQMARSAGVGCFLLDKGGKPGHALVQVASKEQRYVPLKCVATIGQVSNPQHHLINLGKAGRSRWLGRRPSVRGVAMNPVDHPMGGGEGRSSGGRHSCSPTGLLSKGYKTVRSKYRRNPLVAVRAGGLKKR
eukprot:CAMPEP_0175132840 /NCGR_PEP_ID=MMETSP0087-20121206/7295_1 /TAXON_ID=136419 /ORGANISM="Unknown Unknown, Strain D1" /LENGTH=339 /DNA_ID=CAMNT_0016415233 /DNA_START=137 /DNA_END=1156 /DNA_ORIENTATION=-